MSPILLNKKFGIKAKITKLPKTKSIQKVKAYNLKNIDFENKTTI